MNCITYSFLATSDMAAGTMFRYVWALLRLLFGCVAFHVAPETAAAGVPAVVLTAPKKKAGRESLTPACLACLSSLSVSLLVQRACLVCLSSVPVQRACPACLSHVLVRNQSKSLYRQRSGVTS